MFCTVHFKGNESEKEFDNAKKKKKNNLPLVWEARGRQQKWILL